MREWLLRLRWLAARLWRIVGARLESPEVIERRIAEARCARLETQARVAGAAAARWCRFADARRLFSLEEHIFCLGFHDLHVGGCPTCLRPMDEPACRALRETARGRAAALSEATARFAAAHARASAELDAELRRGDEEQRRAWRAAHPGDPPPDEPEAPTAAEMAADFGARRRSLRLALEAALDSIDTWFSIAEDTRGDTTREKMHREALESQEEAVRRADDMARGSPLAHSVARELLAERRETCGLEPGCLR